MTKAYDEVRRALIAIVKAGQDRDPKTGALKAPKFVKALNKQLFDRMEGGTFRSNLYAIRRNYKPHNGTLFILTEYINSTNTLLKIQATA